MGGGCLDGQRQKQTDLPLGESPGNYLQEGWVGPRAGLERYGEEKIYCTYWCSKPDRSKP